MNATTNIQIVGIDYKNCLFIDMICENVNANTINLQNKTEYFVDVFLFK